MECQLLGSLACPLHNLYSRCHGQHRVQHDGSLLHNTVQSQHHSNSLLAWHQSRKAPKGSSCQAYKSCGCHSLPSQPSVSTHMYSSRGGPTRGAPTRYYINALCTVGQLENSSDNSIPPVLAQLCSHQSKQPSMINQGYRALTCIHSS
jgi:hypothetical protein